MVAEFKANKKYKHHMDDTVVYTCEFANPKGGLLRYVDRAEEFYYFEDMSQHYYEYSPPVVHKRWVHFWRIPSSPIVETTTRKDENWRPATWAKYLGCVPVEFTEKDD